MTHPLLDLQPVLEPHTKVQHLDIEVNYIEGDDVTQDGTQGVTQGEYQGGTQDGAQGGTQGIPYPISSTTSTTTSPLREMTFLMRS